MALTRWYLDTRAIWPSEDDVYSFWLVLTIAATISLSSLLERTKPSPIETYVRSQKNGPCLPSPAKALHFSLNK